METKRECYLHKDTEHIIDLLLKYQEELLVLEYKVDFVIPKLAYFPVI